MNDPLFGQQPVEEVGAPLDADRKPDQDSVRGWHSVRPAPPVFDGQRRGAEGDPSHLTLVHRSAARNPKKLNQSSGALQAVVLQTIGWACAGRKNLLSPWRGRAAVDKELRNAPESAPAP